MCSIVTIIVTNSRNVCYVDCFDLLGNTEVPQGHVALIIGCNWVVCELEDRIVEAKVLRVEIVIIVRDIVLPRGMGVQRWGYNTV